jgi:hypothetical protein
MAYYSDISKLDVSEDETSCNDFGPWVWANGIQYFSDKSFFSRDEVKLNPVPKSTENISKELIKLKWHLEDIEVFSGFGPWTKPSGFEPPIIQDKQKQTKKKKKKEITSKINTELPKTKDEPDEPEISSKKKEQGGSDIIDIAALSSHKTHSTPVDPTELRKRLVDLLIQRTKRGDLRALKLKKVMVKPIQVSRLNPHYDNQQNRYNNVKRAINARDEDMCNTGDNGNDIQPVPAHPSQFPHTNMCFADQTRKGIALQSSFTGSSTNFGQYSPFGHPLENIECDKGVRLPPVTQMVTHNGKVSFVHKWPSSSSITVRNVKNRISKKQDQTNIVQREHENIYIKNSSMIDLINSDNFKLESGIQTERSKNGRGRKLGDLSQNTRSECVKSRVGVYKS